jgi:16S rRNA (guanine527-N7)-methyltransferase
MITPVARKSVPARNANADRERALTLMPIPPSVLSRLDRLVELLLQWQKRMNLIAPSTIPEIWTRHIADSLQLALLAPHARVWVDLGSGAGFPGIVLACALADEAGARVHLVESNAKKAAFLREAGRVLDIPATIHGARIEDFVQSLTARVDAVTARALAPLTKLLEFAAPLLKTGAKGLFPKGQDVEGELTEAAKYWSIDFKLVPSKTSPQGKIIIVESATRRGKG